MTVPDPVVEPADAVDPVPVPDPVVEPVIDSDEVSDPAADIDSMAESETGGEPVPEIQTDQHGGGPGAIDFRLALVSSVTLDLPSQHPSVVLRELDTPRRQLTFSIGMPDAVALSHAFRRIPTRDRSLKSC